MRVCDIMMKDVPVLSPEMSFSEAVNRLIDSGLSGLPVTDKSGTVLGIVTEADALTFLEFQNTLGLDDYPELGSDEERLAFIHSKVKPRGGKLVLHVMNQTPIVCTPDMKVDELVELMIDKGVRLLPVVEEGKLAGLVNRRSLIKLLLKAEKTVDLNAK